MADDAPRRLVIPRPASWRAVAADARVTRANVYRQFGSKLGLLDAVEDLAQRSHW